MRLHTINKSDVEKIFLSMAWHYKGKSTRHWGIDSLQAVASGSSTTKNQLDMVKC